MSAPGPSCRELLCQLRCTASGSASLAALAPLPRIAHSRSERPWAALLFPLPGVKYRPPVGFARVRFPGARQTRRLNKTGSDYAERYSTHGWENAPPCPPEQIYSQDHPCCSDAAGQRRRRQTPKRPAAVHLYYGHYQKRRRTTLADIANTRPRRLTPRCLPATRSSAGHLAFSGHLKRPTKRPGLDPGHASGTRAGTRHGCVRPSALRRSQGSG